MRPLLGRRNRPRTCLPGDFNDIVQVKWQKISFLYKLYYRVLPNIEKKIFLFIK